MREAFREVSDQLKNVKWAIDNGKRTIDKKAHMNLKNNQWPLGKDLKRMMRKKDNLKRDIGEHVLGVIASVNSISSEDFDPARQPRFKTSTSYGRSMLPLLGSCQIV